MSQQETKDSALKNLLQEIVEKSSEGEYIYRGEPENFANISSTLYRGYEEQIVSQPFDIEIAQKEMLEQVKAFTSFGDDTDILTELQHYGGNTNLIDFSTDYLIALFFACDSSFSADGRLILLDRSSKQERIKMPKKNQNNRVISQKSIFVQSPKGLIDTAEVEIVQIPKELKHPALNYLKRHHGITTETIYNDILGYITNQHKHHSAYAEFYLGNTYYEKNNYEEAILHYDTAISLNPISIVTYHNRGVAKTSQGMYKEAINDLNVVVNNSQRNADAHVDRGRAYSLHGQFGKAIEDFDSAILFDRGNPRTYFLRGFAYASLGERQKALGDYRMAYQDDPKSFDKYLAEEVGCAEAYFVRGQNMSTNNLYEEAIADYSAAIRIDPEYVEALNHRGNVFDILGQREEAIEDYDGIIRIKPNDVDAYFRRGNSKVELELYKNAIFDFDEALRICQEYTKTGHQYGGPLGGGTDKIESALRVGKGRAQIGLEQYEDAISSVNPVIDIAQEHAPAYFVRGVARKHLRQFSDARKDLNRAQSLAQGNTVLSRYIRDELNDLDSSDPANQSTS